METIPVINCGTVECAKERLAVLSKIPSAWVHVDVSDGFFSGTVTHVRPDQYRDCGKMVEVHLMVRNPEDAAEYWLAAGARRLIVHVESLGNYPARQISRLLEACAARGAELMLAEKPSTPVDAFYPYANHISSFQLLAVPPGPAGQRFDPRTFEKIRALREKFPEARIEIDGGVTPEIAREACAAGVTAIAAATYIFGNDDPVRAYETLRAIG